MQNFNILLGPTIDNLLQEFSKAYAKNPLGTDTKLNNYVISQTGQFPITPLAYHQRCGNAFWWPQTCEEKNRVQQEVISQKNAYYSKYQTIRSDFMMGIAETLKKSQDRESLLVDFQNGDRILQLEVKKQMNKIQSLQKFENIAWSAFTLASTLITGQTQNKYIISAVSFANSALRDISEQAELDLKSLHRFSEEPPNFSEKTLSTKGLQWDHTVYIVTLLNLIEEYQNIYFSVFPEMKVEQTNTSFFQNQMIIFFFAAIIILKNFSTNN